MDFKPPNCHGCKHLEFIDSRIGEYHYYQCRKMDVELDDPPIPVNLYCYESINEVEQPEIDDLSDLGDYLDDSID